jgi:hypothetical protein
MTTRTLRITIRRIRQCLPLHLEVAPTYSQVPFATGVSKATVGKFVVLVGISDVDRVVPKTLIDEQNRGSTV